MSGLGSLVSINQNVRATGLQNVDQPQKTDKISGVDTHESQPSGVDLKTTQQRMHRLADSTVKFSSQSLMQESLNKITQPDQGVKRNVKSAYNGIATASQNAQKAMGKLDAKSIMSFRAPTEDVHKDLETAVKAQNNLRAALIKYGDLAKVDVSEQVRLCDNRIGEMLNFVGTMMSYGSETAVPLQTSKQTFSENVNAISLDMHASTQITTALKAEINSLYEKIDGLEQNAGMMDKFTFDNEISFLTENLETAMGKLQSFKDGTYQAEKKTSVVFDKKALDVIELSLTSANSRVKKLAQANPPQVFQQMIESLRANYTISPFAREYVNSVNISSANPNFRDSIQQYFNAVDIAFTELSKNPANPTSINTAIQNVEYIRANNQTATSLGQLNFYIHLASIENPENYVAQIKDFVKTNANANLIINEIIQPLRNAMNPRINSDAKQNTDEITKLRGLTSKMLPMELDRLGKLMNNSRFNFHQTGQYIATAFNNPVNVDTMVELKIRGFPFSSVALNAIDEKLVEEKKLGQGAANQVFLCKYTLETGQNVSYVFKGEHDARRGLDGLMVGKLGYTRDIYVNQINVVASEASELIGCGSAIAKSTVGMHKGQFGLFMEHAPGETLKSLDKGKPALTIGSKSYKLEQLGQVFKTQEQQRIFLGSLVTELSKLEWSDALTGQVDRHADNYLFSVNPETGKVKITGIDNDASYSQRMVGVGKLEVKQNDESKVSEDKKDKKPKIIDLSTVNPILAKKTTGINQMFKPMVISQSVYDNIVNLNEDTYRALLNGKIPPAEIESAMKRLADCKIHANELRKDGKCIPDDQFTNPDKLQMILGKIAEQSYDTSFFNQNFISRDFSCLLRMFGSAVGR